ncbi:aldo/keto reductase [Micrococcales bacterium 31B]|nr:aldo/keto reductase [Micrococcales bacterium 31B]
MEINSAPLAPGVQIPLIGLGTWPLRGEEASRAVAHALELGYQHVDTAENYQNEEAVGEGIRRSGIDRDDIFITTKFNTEWHSRDGVREAFARSARRLGVDYLDLLLVHWPNPQQGRFVEACEGLQALADQGLIRSWGVSNFKPEHLDLVMDTGLRVPINQVQIDPTTSQPELLAYHREHAIQTAAYSPLGRGAGFLDAPALTVPAAELGKTPAQVALRWHMQHGRVAVPKSADPTRQRQNLEVFDFALTSKQMLAIDALESGAPARLDSDVFFH